MANTEFAAAKLTLGQLNAIVKKLGGHEGALRFLRDEIRIVEPDKRWREEDGIIYFSVTSDGTTGQQWIDRLNKKGYCLDSAVENILCSRNFEPSSGVTIKVALLKGMLWNDDERNRENVLSKAIKSFEFASPPFEVLCLIRDSFSDEEIDDMGVSKIISFKKPTVVVSCGGKGCYGDWMNHLVVQEEDSLWHRSVGFAFVIRDAMDAE
ncbi:MAG TPA: hypothetical protein PLB38_03415 [bacterium]|nr:hypothetical protein [bacterium]